MIILYHQTKTSIGFWCRRGLNPRSLIQSLETLLVELTGSYIIFVFIKVNLSVYSTEGSQSCTEVCFGLTSGTIYFGTGQYRCTVSGLPLFFIYIYIYMCVCVCVCVCVYYNKYKSLP